MVTYHRISPVDDDHAKLRVVLATRSRTASEVSVELAVPAGFVVTGMSLSMTGAEPVVATAGTSAENRDDYEATVAAIKDPALLEWADARHVRLRVFPVTRDASATVTLELVARGRYIGTEVDRQTSLLAIPGEAQQPSEWESPAWATYWPAHNSELGVPDVRGDES